MAAAWLLAQSLTAGARVLVCAGPGCREALAEVGLVAVDDGPADAVVVGFHRTFDFDGLDRASAARAGRARVRRHQHGRHLSGPRRADPRRGSRSVAAVATAAGRRPRWRASRRRRPSASSASASAPPAWWWATGRRPTARWRRRSGGRSRSSSRGSPPRSRPRVARPSPNRRPRSSRADLGALAPRLVTTLAAVG